MTSLATEYEDELELEQEDEDELEDEAFLSTLGGIARTVGGLLGEGEEEIEGEWEEEVEAEDEWEVEGEEEEEYEDEGEGEGEQFDFGGIVRGIGGLLGESEEEAEEEWESEGEFEDEAELFFGKVWRGLKKVVKNPIFRRVVKTVGPLVATAVGGPAAGALARAATSQLEGEIEGELEAEFEDMASAPLSGSQSLAEYFAAQAASAESEAEAEAFAGVAAYTALSARDRRELERLLPALLRGASVIARLLRRDPRTSPAVRLLPGIVDATGRTAARRIGTGVRVGPADLGAIMARAATRVLAGTGPRAAVARRHAFGLTHVRRHRRRHPRRGYGGYAGYRGGMGRRRSAGIPRGATMRRQPVRSALTTARRVPRPRPGFVRVVTPMRVPSAGGSSRTVRVVSDVRVPRGAVPVGRPVSVGGRRRAR